MKFVHIIVSFFLFLSANIFPLGQSADATLDAPIWPEWVHKHWVWENEGTQESAMKLVQDYIDLDIPVGAMIIDRPWATFPTTYNVDPTRYPDLAEYVEDFHDMDVRVVMWATSVINKEAEIFEEAKENGYFLSDGKIVKWWAGEGAFIDYTNPEAVDWWHKQMDRVLDMGIDGWKVDGTDPYMMLLFPAVGHDGKTVSWKEYKDQTYDDFFNYTREKLGNDRVIMARPVDDLLARIGLPLTSANRDVNFAGWVGDQDNDWNGLKHTLNNMFSSTMFDYVSYGTDIGGFRREFEPDKNVFLRWAQLGAFCPIMENGGGGTHEPWKYDDETTEIYRKFVELHTAMIPYIYSSAAYSYEIEKPTMRPQIGEYTYLLGNDILVAPYFTADVEREVKFPKGEWIYMFDESKVYDKGTEKFETPLDEFPAYIRKGAIVPMNVVNGANGFGSELSADYTTVMIYPEDGSKKFGLYEEGKDGTMLSYTKDGGEMTVKSTASERSLLFRIYNDKTAASVKIAGTELTKAASMADLTSMAQGYFTENNITWIAVDDVNAGVEIAVNF